MEKIKVNILTGTPDRDRFLRQLDKKKFNEIDFYENSTENIIWDLLIVYEEIVKCIKVKCKVGGVLFISGEPPMSRVYSSRFLKQFDHLITSHAKIKHSNNHIMQQALDWHYGFDYIKKEYNSNFKKIENLSPNLKTKNISVISSGKKMMPGHKKRYKFLKKLKKDFANEIDFYGKDSIPVADKAEAINHYRFHICIENSFINDYWTEKIADPILGFSVPIYCGCKNIQKYFNEKSIIRIDLSNYADAKEKINKIIANPDKVYVKHLESLREDRNKLLHKYNIFDVIFSLYENKICKSENFKEITVLTNQDFKDYKIKLLILRFKRLVYRFF